MKIRHIFQTITATLVMVTALAVPVVVSSETTVQAAAPTSVRSGATNTKPAGATDDITPFLKSIANILLFIIGAASVIVIIIGGVRYVTSAGDSNAVNSAKNTILYAVVGLVVAAMAYAIVNFVITSI